MPLKAARTITSPAEGAGSSSSRISPRPGEATQNARAAPAAIRQFWCFGARDTIPARGVLTFSTLYLVKAAGSFALILAIALWRRRAHHPFPRFGAANQITTFRAFLVSLVAALIGEPMRPVEAASLALAATLLDGVDGWLARRSKMESAFGARFDVEVDALLILVLAVLVWQYEKAGPWVLASGLLRYGFVAAGRIWPWMSAPLTPTMRGRVICIVQLAGLMLALLPAFPSPASDTIAAAALAALTYSFAVDVGRLRRMNRT
jgi:phosphatidylglycerophosphate synthase